jgi:hypothetical protein
LVTTDAVTVVPSDQAPSTGSSKLPLARRLSP